jgi:hypothetical protein
MNKVSVDEKGQLWWIGAFLWGYVTFLTLISLSAVDLFSLPLFIGALILGAVLGVPAWRKWRAGGFVKGPPEPLSIEFADTPEDKGEYSFRFVGKTKTKVGPSVKEPKVTYGTFVLWWIFVRAPILVGDWLLSSFYGLFARFAADSIPGVGRLPGFGERERSLLEQARDQNLIEKGDDIDNPHIGKF